MDWWNNFVDWLNSNDGWRVISTAVIPFLAILVAGIIGGAIGRGSVRRVIELSDREIRASAVTALISAARKAAVWNTISAPEQQHIDHLIGDADIRLRLLPVPGTALAADWASHEIIGMKKNAVSFSFQAEQSLIVFRDRLIDWQGRPGRAKKLFKNDLDSWAYDSSLSDQEVVHQQQAWAAQQVTDSVPVETVTKSPFTRPAAPPPLVVPELVVPVPVVSAPDVVEPEIVATSVSTPAIATPAIATPVSQAPALSQPESHPLDTAMPTFRAPILSAFATRSVSTPAEEIPALVEPELESPRDVGEASVFSPRSDNSESQEVDPQRGDSDDTQAGHDEHKHSEHEGNEHEGNEHEGTEHEGHEHEHEHDDNHRRDEGSHHHDDESRA